MTRIAAERAMGATVHELAEKNKLSAKQMTMALNDMGFIKTRGGEKNTEDNVQELTEREKRFNEVCETYDIENTTMNTILTDLGLTYKTGRRTNAIGGKKYQIIYDLKLED